MRYPFWESPCHASIGYILVFLLSRQKSMCRLMFRDGSIDAGRSSNHYLTFLMTGTVYEDVWMAILPFYENIWRWNGGIPKSSIFFIGFSSINMYKPSIFGVPRDFRKPPTIDFHWSHMAQAWVPWYHSDSRAGFESKLLIRTALWWLKRLFNHHNQY